MQATRTTCLSGMFFQSAVADPPLRHPRDPQLGPRLNDVQGATRKTDTTSTTEELLWRRQTCHPQQAPAILGNDNSPLHASLALKAPVALQGCVKRLAAEADMVQLMRNYVAQSSARLATTVVCAATCSHPAGLPCWKRQREHTLATASRRQTPPAAISRKAPQWDIRL